MVKARVGSGFPADITFESPLELTKTGRNYHFSLNAEYLADAEQAVIDAQAQVAAATTAAETAATSEANALTYRNAAQTAETNAETAQAAAEAAQEAAETARDAAVASVSRRDLRAIIDAAVPLGQFAETRCVLTKLRADYPEFSIHAPLTTDGKFWTRRFFSNRFNVGSTGATHLMRESLSALYATTTTAPIAENLTTGTQAQAASATEGTADGSYTGSWTGPATVNGVTDIIYSTTPGDKVVHTLTVPSNGRLVWRTLANSTNGGIVYVVVRVNGGAEIASGNYIVPLTSGERRINLAESATGLTLIPLAEGLAAGDYDVEIYVSSANPGSNRGYHGGVNAYAVTAFDAVGRMGTWENRTYGSVSNIPTTFRPGAEAIYEFTGTGCIWRYAQTTSAGQASLHVYDNGGVEIDSGDYDIVASTVECYNGVTQVTQTRVCSGLALGTYYLVIKSLNTKHASSTGYRVPDYGVIAENETTAGVPGTDAFYDYGVTDSTLANGTSTFIGHGNLTHAIKARKTTDASGVETYVGGGHGYEGAPASLVFTVDGSVVDFAGGAVNDTWIGRKIDFTYTTTLKFPSDSSNFCNMSFDYTISAAGMSHRTSGEFTADAVVYDHYALMLVTPNRDTGTTGIDGGFENVEAVESSHVLSAHNDAITTLSKISEQFLAWNDNYAVYGAQTSRSMSSAASLGTPTSIFQDRTDDSWKGYVQFTQTGARTIPAGSTFSHAAVYRCAKIPGLSAALKS
jgi:hypothetical protein